MAEGKPGRSEVVRDPVDAYRADVDHGLIEKNLKLSVEERFLQLMELQRFAAELRKAGERAPAT